MAAAEERGDQELYNRLDSAYSTESEDEGEKEDDDNEKQQSADDFMFVCPP
ncbi:hypothetical protein M569_17623 [Genlisea aurea]|uniref:Uncharacterized protein n=1 Tax=Genlisea aurea TaxID=192259 RepID=S8BS00_9LAMI|nr:hypothetical protein M569_17623 [Genlisea aurea]